MKTRNLALLAFLAAFGWTGALYAQPPYPPPPPPDAGYGQPPYNQPDYNQPDSGNPDDQPYYDDQGPDDAYDNPNSPNYGPGPGPNDPRYNSGYGQPGYPPPDYNQGPADVSVFYSSLHPYGRWIQRSGYGWVWEPTMVRVGWRPYTVGRWVDTDYGWTWVSDEPWGWATYHYGRWLFDSEYGWLWVPGTEWGPAWCSFQEGDGYVGWAPLPPTVGFRAGIGIQIGGLSLSASFTPYAYSFVPSRYFLETRVDRLILPPARNVTLIRSTRNITNITVVNNRIVNRSVPEDRVEQWTGHRVQRFRVADVRNPAQAPRRGAEIQGDQVRIFRPAPTLAPARPNETPQAVINRRAYRPGPPPGQPAAGQQPGQPVQGQAPEGRWRRQPPPQEAQPGQPQPQPVPQSRWQRQPPTPEDLSRKHQSEEQRLQAQQAEERNRLQQVQDQERRDRQNQRDQTRAQQLQAQHQAETRALQEQQQREQQLQRAREQRERQAVESRRNQGPPPQGQDRRNQGGKGQGQGQNQEKNRDRRQQPPPPPPPRR